VQLEYFRVNNRSLRSDKILAEGGFGFVYQVTDEDSGEQYALKKVNISNKETFELIKGEI
jgi:serine/threonine protein kinase